MSLACFVAVNDYIILHNYINVSELPILQNTKALELSSKVCTQRELWNVGVKMSPVALPSLFFFFAAFG